MIMQKTEFGGVIAVDRLHDRQRDRLSDVVRVVGDADGDVDDGAAVLLLLLDDDTLTGTRAISASRSWASCRLVPSLPNRTKPSLGPALALAT